MAKAKKDGKLVNYYIDNKILSQLEKYSEKTGIPKTTIVEKALKEYLSNNRVKK